MKPSIDDILKEVNFKTSRSGGSGGQNVNKVSTKVEVIFSIENSLLFNPEEKTLLLQKLAQRIDGDGLLHIVSQEERSQLLNKRRALLKLQVLLLKSLEVQKPRKATKVPKKVKEQRIKDKAKMSETKNLRKKIRSF